MNEGLVHAPVHQVIGMKPGFGDIFKRAFDIFVSLIVLILLAPFFGLIALAIKRDSPGPVIYRGRRIGRGGKVFRILKFRTMYENSKSYAGPKVTAHNDDRITNLGRWLRDTKVNELPQFWNVLVGDMSLVGPRPEDPDLAKTWPLGMMQEILSVRPGITSPASVQYHNEESLLSMDNVLQTYVDKVGPDKLRLDQLYVRYRSFWLDLDVLMWTVFILLPKFNSSALPEELLFLGPVSRLVRRYLNWFSVDLLTTIVAFTITCLFWRTSRPLNLGLQGAVLATIGFSLLFSLAGALFGVNHISWSKATVADAFDLLTPWLTSLAAALIVNATQHIFPNLLLMAAFGVALYGYILTRYRSRLIHGLIGRIIQMRSTSKASRERVLIIGTNTTSQMVAWLLNHPMNAFQFQIVGFVDENLLNQGLRMYGSRVLGTCKDISRLIKQHDIGVVIMTGQDGSQDWCMKIENMCQGTSVKLLMIPDILGSLGNFIGAVNTRRSASLEIPITGDGQAPVSAQFAEVNNIASSSACQYCLSRYTEVGSPTRLAGLNQPIPTCDLRVPCKTTGELKTPAIRMTTGELRMTHAPEDRK